VTEKDDGGTVLVLVVMGMVGTAMLLPLVLAYWRETWLW
jgi:hypothetical protein